MIYFFKKFILFNFETIDNIKNILSLYIQYIVSDASIVFIKIIDDIKHILSLYVQYVYETFFLKTIIVLYTL